MVTLLPARPHVARLLLRRDQRAPAEPGADAGEVQGRLLRRPRPVEALQEHVPALRRPDARVVRDGVQGERRLVLGAAGWQRMLPNVGYVPWKHEQKVWELHISHWTGETAQLEVYADWVYGGRFHEVFGRATYSGQPIYGFSTTHSGKPLDTFGRLIFLDTLDSAYGAGWKRENSFVVHKPSGMFCYGFYPYSHVRELSAPALAEAHRQRRAVPPHALRARRHAGRDDDRATGCRITTERTRRCSTWRADEREGPRDGRAVRRAALRPPLTAPPTQPLPRLTIKASPRPRRACGCRS